MKFKMKIINIHIQNVKISLIKKNENNDNNWEGKTKIFFEMCNKIKRLYI